MTRSSVKPLERLSDRDLWVLRQLRAKIGEWDIGDRVHQNLTSHETVLILRALDFAMAAEEYLREQERRFKQVSETPKALEDTSARLAEEKKL